MRAGCRVWGVRLDLAWRFEGLGLRVTGLGLRGLGFSRVGNLEVLWAESAQAFC